jgi:hypothetical protein
MKRAIVLTALLSVLFACTAIPQEPVAKNHVKTYSLLPSKTLNIVNKDFRYVEIRSEYPIQIAAGPCHTGYTVQWKCQLDEPMDLFIRDLRKEPIFSTPRANTITLTFRMN